MEPPQHTSTTCHDSNPRYIITIWMTGPSFGQDVWIKKNKIMFETRSLDEFYINFVQLDYTRLKLFSSYLRFFARIWFRSCKICDAVDLEKQTNAGAIRRLENKTWGFFWIRWCCRHFLPFQLCHNINIVTTLSQQMSQLCHNKSHKNNAKHFDGDIKKWWRWLYILEISLHQTLMIPTFNTFDITHVLS